MSRRWLLAEFISSPKWSKVQECARNIPASSSAWGFPKRTYRATLCCWLTYKLVLHACDVWALVLFTQIGSIGLLPITSPSTWTWTFGLKAWPEASLHFIWTFEATSYWIRPLVTGLGSEWQLCPRSQTMVFYITFHLRSFNWRCWGWNLHAMHVLHHELGPYER